MASKAKGGNPGGHGASSSNNLGNTSNAQSTSSGRLNQGAARHEHGHARDPRAQDVDRQSITGSSRATSSSSSSSSSSVASSLLDGQNSGGGGGSGNANVYLPLFERLENVEIQELQHCKQMIEKLRNRVKDLEQINLNLEHRLENESKSNITLERKCVQLQNSWREKTNLLSKEIEDQQREIKNQEEKNEKLRLNLSRKEQELYGIYQRKHEYMKGGAAYGRTGLNTSSSISDGGNTNAGNSNSNINSMNIKGGNNSNKKSDSKLDGSITNSNNNNNNNNTEDLYQIRAPQDARQRKMTANLSDFLGLGFS